MSVNGELVYAFDPDTKLPEGWNVATLESIVSDRGVFCDGDWVESKDQDPNGDVRLIQLADIGVGSYRDKSDRYLTSQKAAALSCTYLQRGDVLVARMPDPLGRACLFPGDNKKAVTVVDVAVVRPSNPQVDSRWLMHRINSQHFRQAVSSLQSGSTRLRISRRNLSKIAFPLPPLAQQMTAVNEIEKQFSRLDEAIANLQRVKANLKRYKASVLKAAVEGRLVPTEAELARREGREIETGQLLLRRILATRHESWVGKYETPVDPIGVANTELPEGWTWITVSQAMRERIVNGLSIKESTTATEVRALRLSAMKEQSLDLDDFRYLPIEASKVNDILIRESDFFVSRGNGSLELVGRGCRAQKPMFPVIFPDTMMRVRFSTVANVIPWFQALWSTRLLRKQIEQRVKTTAGIYKIAQPELASIEVPLPPLAEQVRIVAEVDHRMSVLRKVEAEVNANLKRAGHLRQSTLVKSFATD